MIELEINLQTPLYHPEWLPFLILARTIMNLKPDEVFMILKECYIPQWAYISLAGIMIDRAADKIIFIMITAFILSPWLRLSDLGFAEFYSTSILCRGKTHVLLMLCAL